MPRALGPKRANRSATSLNDNPSWLLAKRVSTPPPGRSPAAAMSRSPTAAGLTATTVIVLDSLTGPPRPVSGSCRIGRVTDHDDRARRVSDTVVADRPEKQPGERPAPTAANY